MDWIIEWEEDRHDGVSILHKEYVNGKDIHDLLHMLAERFQHDAIIELKIRNNDQ